MVEDQLVGQIELARLRTLKWAESVTEDIADIIPQGFRNNIRWHLGHIYTVSENLTFSKIGEAKLPEEFSGWFANGTSPADWKQQPPSVDTLRSLLQEQSERAKKLLAGRFSEKIAEPFSPRGSSVTMATLGDLVVFNLYHEGNHLGFAKAIQKALQK